MTDLASCEKYLKNIKHYSLLLGQIYSHLSVLQYYLILEAYSDIQFFSSLVLGKLITFRNK